MDTSTEHRPTQATGWLLTLAGLLPIAGVGNPVLLNLWGASTINDGMRIIRAHHAAWLIAYWLIATGVAAGMAAVTLLAPRGRRGGGLGRSDAVRRRRCIHHRLDGLRYAPPLCGGLIAEASGIGYRRGHAPAAFPPRKMNSFPRPDTYRRGGR